MSRIRHHTTEYGSTGIDGQSIGNPEVTCRYQPVNDPEFTNDAYSFKGHFMRARSRVKPTPGINPTMPMGPPPPTLPSSSSSTSSISNSSSSSSLSTSDREASEARRRAAILALADEDEELEIVTADEAEKLYIPHVPSTPAIAAQLAAQQQAALTSSSSSSSSSSTSGPLPMSTSRSLARIDWLFGLTCSVREIGTGSLSMSLTCVPLPQSPEDEDDHAAKRQFTAFSHWLHLKIKHHQS